MVFALFTAVTTIGMQHVLATRHLAEAPDAAELSEGLGSYLMQTPRYSLFNQIVQKLNESTSYANNTVGWFEGPTNQTVLVVADDALREGFAQLAEQYNISDPDTFVDRLVEVADGSTDPRQDTFSTANWAAIALIAFADSHTLPDRHNFYAEQNGRNPPSDGPINVTTSVTGYFPYTGNLQAYATTTPDLVTVYLRQEGGLLHAADGLVVPQALTAFGTNSASDEIGQGSGSATLNVYEMDGIFLYGQTFGPASETGYSGNAALKYFAQNGI